MNLFDGINATCTVTPMSADHHAYMQRMAEWAKNCTEEEWREFECARDDTADRRRDERWADRFEENQ